MTVLHTRPMSLVDAGFFMAESAERTANIGPLAILKVPAHARSVTAFTTQLLARMKKRAVGAPFNLRYRAPGLQGMPLLETVDNVDLDQHCHRHTLSAPGTDTQLFELVCRLHEPLLDRARPPWEMHLIEGLAGRRIAIYAKVHHGLIDGRGMVQLIGNWFSADPDDRTARALWDGFPVRRSSSERKAPPALNTAQLLGKLGAAAKSVGSLYAAVARQALASAKLAPGMRLPFIGTSGALQGKPSVKRCFAYCVLPLAQVKTFGKAHEATVNDVLLTVLDMAMNQYLAGRGQGTHAPLVADMPVALGGGDGAGNNIAVLQFPLGSAQASPRERLSEIRGRTAEIKQHVKCTDANALMAYTVAVHLVPALLELVGAPQKLVLANVVISNPFGLPERRYLAGAEVEMALPISVLMPGLALNVTAVTYDQGLQVAFLGLEADLPDLQRLAELTSEAFVELTQPEASAAPTAETKPAAAKQRKRAPRAARKTRDAADALREAT